jgi:phosphomannomutase
MSLRRCAPQARLLAANSRDTSSSVIARLQATGLSRCWKHSLLWLQYQKPFSEIAHPFEPYPQKLISVPVRDKHSWQSNAEIQAQVQEAERLLGTRGRINIRASGTENLIRVMVEAETPELVDAALEPVVNAVKRALG